MIVIGGQHKNRKLVAPKGNKTRPTSARIREALFNILQTDIQGINFLDLFAGTGAIAIEALSRGATSATLIEADFQAQKAIIENINSLALKDSAKLIKADVFKSLKNFEQRGLQFDIIYADPPYHKETSLEKPLSSQLLEILDTSSLLNSEGIFILEEQKKYLVPDNLQNMLLINSRTYSDSAIHIFKKIN